MTLRSLRHSSLASQILGALIVGVTAGGIARRCLEPGTVDFMVGHLCGPLGTVFLRLVMMLVVPLTFTAIVLGVLEIGDPRRLGRTGAQTFLWVILLAGAGIVVAIGLSRSIRPGERASPERRAALIADYTHGHHASLLPAPAESKPLLASLVELVPDNPLADAAAAFKPTRTGGGILGVMVFAVFVGVAASLLPAESVAPLRKACACGFAVCMRIIGFALTLAPLCVLCLGFAATARLGLEIFATLGAYVGVVLLGLAIQALVVYPLVLRVFAGRSPVRFFADSREATFLAFSTASSNATLPVALRVATDKLGISPPTSRFVLTLGAAMNHNGTALYEAATAFFLAQLFGLELTTLAQLQIALMCMVASIGAGGIPGGGLAMTVGVLTAIGVPGEAVAIVMGVERLLDMSRTALNVGGDLVIAAIVDRDPPPSPAPLPPQDASIEHFIMPPY